MLLLKMFLVGLYSVELRADITAVYSGNDGQLIKFIAVWTHLVI